MKKFVYLCAMAACQLLWSSLAQAQVAGNQSREDACRATLLAEGTDSQARACSRASDFPSGKRWAQIGERVYDDYLWTGEYLCLGPLVEMTFANGNRHSMRATVRVSQELKGGVPVPGFTVNSIDQKTFASKEEAVIAGCEAQAIKMRDWHGG